MIQGAVNHAKTQNPDNTGKQHYSLGVVRERIKGYKPGNDKNNKGD
jgi:hypothetical protein